MAKEKVEFNVVSSKTELKKMIDEVSGAMTQIEAHRDHIKSIKDRAKEELGIDGKKFGALCKIYHKRERDQVERESEEILELYDDVFSK